MADIADLSFADLFAGVGGMRLGFEQACAEAGVGSRCVYACDINKNAVKTYQSHFHDDFEVLSDIKEVKDIASLPDFDILLGGFPCQSFSLAGHKKGFLDETRGTLFFSLAEFIKVKRPRAFLLENVKHLVNHNKRRTFSTIIGALTYDLGYTVYHQVLNSSGFGVPQNRERIYIVGFSRDGGGFSFPKPVPTARTIGDVLEPGSVSPSHYLSQQYLDTLKRHRARHEKMGHGFGYEVKSPNDIANTILCGGMGKERNLVVDMKLSAEELARGRKTKANSEFVRAMTPLEWERLQGFPDNWTATVSTGSRMDQMGNAVTVPVVKAISANILKELLNPVSVTDPLFS